VFGTGEGLGLVGPGGGVMGANGVGVLSEDKSIVWDDPMSPSPE
jgi:hypothetical protein